MTDNDGAITTKELAKRLGVTAQTVRNYYKDPLFPNPEKRRRGRQTYYVVSEETAAIYESILDDKSDEIGS